MAKLEKGYDSDSMQAILGDVKTYYNGELAQKANTSDLGTAAYKNSTNQVTSGSSALVESGAVKTALDGKVDTHGTDSLMTAEEHTKLAGIDLTQYEKSGVAETLIKDTVGWSGINKFDISLYTPSVGKGFTVSKDNDTGLITISGTYIGTNAGYGFFLFNAPYIIGTKIVMVDASDSMAGNELYWNDTTNGKIVCNLYNLVNGQSYTFTFKVMAVDEDLLPTAYEPYHSTVDTAKADKVTNATSGHLAGLDSNGNLTDSGVSPTEEITVEGNPVTFDSPFEQDAKSVVVSVKPIQDLHGYDHPWPAGGGKNKSSINDCNASASTDLITQPISIGIERNYTISMKLKRINGATVENPNLYAFRVNEYDSTDTIINTINSNIQYLPANLEVSFSQTVTLDSNTAYITITYGNFNDDANINTHKYDIQAEEGSTATSYAPYSNICPISGIDEVEIEASGKNWLDVSTYTANKFLDASGEEVDANSYAISKFIRVKPSTQYVASGVSSVNGTYMAFYDAYQNFISSMAETANGFTFTTPNNASYVKMSLRNVTLNTPQLELGTTATPYEPYKSSTTTIPLPSTLYDADVDVTEGDADETHELIDLKSLSYEGTSVGGLSWHDIPNLPNLTPQDVISDKIRYVANADSAWQSTIPCYTIRNNNTAIRIYGSTSLFTTGDYADTHMCIPLVTPTTLSFDPADVELLEGTNVVSTNGEKVAVTYKAGILATLGDIDDVNDKVKTKFDKKDVAKVEGANASKPYSVGDYMLRSDGFYVVTQAIAQNAPITSNNTDKTTIGESLPTPAQLNAVNSLVNSNLLSRGLKWFDFNHSMVGSISTTYNFGQEYTITIPQTEVTPVRLETSELLQIAYEINSEPIRTNYAIVNMWDSNSCVMATFFDVDEDGNMFYIRIYDYDSSNNQYKMKADYVNGFSPSTPTTFKIGLFYQSYQRWKY